MWIVVVFQFEERGPVSKAQGGGGLLLGEAGGEAFFLNELFECHIIPRLLEFQGYPVTPTGSG